VAGAGWAGPAWCQAAMWRPPSGGSAHTVTGAWPRAICGMTAAPRGDTLLIAGTPATAGDFSVTVSVSDTESPAQTGTGRLVLVVDGPVPPTAPATP